MTELKLPEVNRVILSGRLTRDPEPRYAADGTAVTSFTLAFHRRYRARDGRFAEQTGYATILAYQRLAEEASAAQKRTAFELGQIAEDVADVRTRLLEMERMLKEVG